MPSWRWTTGCALTCGVLLFSSMTAVAEVLVVTDGHHPVQSITSARVVELDSPGRLEAELFAALPADPEQAAALARERLRQGAADLQHGFALAYQGVADAWRLGVAKIPAVVVDRRYVIYGEPDVARAVARIEAYRGAQR